VNDAPSPTFFTEPPEWGWIIVVYFFLGGIAGGLAFLGALLDLFGRPEDRRTSRVAHLIAAPLMIVCLLLLIVDLNRPERFWRMMLRIEDDVPQLMFKYWSPISFGVWGVGVFSIVASLLFVAILAESGTLPRDLAFLRQGALGSVLTALSGLFGLFTAGYTGILLAATNRPLWADTTLLGVLFLLSGVSAAAALLMLLGYRQAHPGTVRWLGWMDTSSSLLELVVLAVLALTIWSVASEVLEGGWGILLLVGTVLLGILVPLVLHWRPRLLGNLTVPSAALLVIAGSFVLRTVVVLAGEAA
jgi:protein NrfD